MKARAGFTLIELLAVMVIVSALGALVLPRLAGGRSRDRVLAQARSLVSLARAARARATSEGRAYLVVVDPVAAELRLARRRDPLAEPTDPDDPERELPGEDQSWSRPLPFEDGVEVAEAQVLDLELAIGDLVTITFRPTGEADAAHVVFEGKDGDRAHVSVEPVLGRATILEELAP